MITLHKSLRVYIIKLVSNTKKKIIYIMTMIPSIYNSIKKKLFYITLGGFDLIKGNTSTYFLFNN